MREGSIFLTIFSFFFICTLYYLKTMAILERSDVQFTHIDSESFIINTSPSKYGVVRNLLSILEKEYELPVHYASEELGAKMVVMSKLLTGKVDTDQITIEEGLNPRYENKFYIEGSRHRLVGKNKEKMMELVKDIVSRLESLDLTVVIQEDYTPPTKELSTNSSPSTIVIAVEIITKSFSKLSEKQELWENIPEQVQKDLKSGDIEKFKDIVRASEFLGRGMTAISGDLVKKIQKLLESGSLSSISDLDGRKEARGFLLLLDLYHTFDIQ